MVNRNSATDLAVPDVPEWIRVECAKKEHFRREALKVREFSVPRVIDQ